MTVEGPLHHGWEGLDRPTFRTLAHPTPPVSSGHQQSIGPARYGFSGGSYGNRVTQGTSLAQQYGIGDFRHSSTDWERQDIRQTPTTGPKPFLPQQTQGSVHSHHSNNFSTGEGGLVRSTKTNYNSLLSGGPRLASFANEGIIRSAEVTRGTAASSANPFSINRYHISPNSRGGPFTSFGYPENIYPR